MRSYPVNENHNGSAVRNKQKTNKHLVTFVLGHKHVAQTFDNNR